MVDQLLPPTRFLAVTGVLLPDGRLFLHPGFVTDDPTGATDAPESPLVAEFADGAGTVLLRVGVPVAPFLVELPEPIEDDIVEGPDVKNQAVAGKLPYPERTRLIRFLLRDVPIHELSVSERGPELKVDWEGLGEAAGRQRLSWSAEHPEGREVHYLVAYSNDGGATWLPLAPPSPATELEVDFDNLPGGRGRLRVLATDGTATTSSDSPVLKVPRKPPIATIFEPPDGAELPAGQPVLLHGQGYYLEERRAELEKLTWTSSVDGPLGVGAAIQAELRPGEHRITLAVGTERRGSEASITVRVR